MTLTQAVKRLPASGEFWVPGVYGLLFGNGRSLPGQDRKARRKAEPGRRHGCRKSGPGIFRRTSGLHRSIPPICGNDRLLSFFYYFNRTPYLALLVVLGIITACSADRYRAEVTGVREFTMRTLPASGDLVKALIEQIADELPDFSWHPLTLLD